MTFLRGLHRVLTSREFTAHRISGLRLERYSRVAHFCLFTFINKVGPSITRLTLRKAAVDRSSAYIHEDEGEVVIV